MSASPELAITDLKALQRCADNEIGGLAWPTIMLSSLAIAGFAAATAGAAMGALPLWIAALVNIPCYFIAYTGLHEATHRNFHGRNTAFRWLNPLYGTIIGAIMFYPYSMHDYLHLSHHAHTNNPDKDPDHWMSGASAGEVALRAGTLPWRYWSFTIRTKMKSVNGGKFFRRIAFEMIPTYAALAALIIFGQWKVALFVWFIPLLLGVALLGVCFDWIVHHPHQQRNLFAATRVLTSENRLKRRILNTVLLGQNLHIIHHIYPRVPFYRYEKVYERSEAFLRAQNVNIIEFDGQAVFERLCRR
ncbi:fatty acid desaturase [Hyphococcus sp.]|uniref:fatty acid desaturase n=1 Tax=Hyphococcus sp. TaxID=2038636 RepID=UPI00208C4D56|nr:MAG: hypothetical protein DHS20C04_15560 [Marinicaulis sp.]